MKRSDYIHDEECRYFDGAVQVANGFQQKTGRNWEAECTHYEKLSKQFEQQCLCYEEEIKSLHAKIDALRMALKVVL